MRFLSKGTQWCKIHAYALSFVDKRHWNETNKRWQDSMRIDWYVKYTYITEYAHKIFIKLSFIMFWLKTLSSLSVSRWRNYSSKINICAQRKFAYLCNFKIFQPHTQTEKTCYFVRLRRTKIIKTLSAHAINCCITNELFIKIKSVESETGGRRGEEKGEIEAKSR